MAYLREHDAAAALPILSMRRPLHSLGLLFQDRTWLTGFAMETAGFLLYAAALALAPLALVQSIGASGIGILAFPPPVSVTTASVHGRSPAWSSTLSDCSCSPSRWSGASAMGPAARSKGSCCG